MEGSANDLNGMPKIISILIWESNSCRHSDLVFDNYGIVIIVRSETQRVAYIIYVFSLFY